MLLNSVEDALLALQQIEDGETDDLDEITFGGELSTVKIVVDGSRYHGTVPGELARGLWEFQAALYRASAFALTGVEDIKKLSADQRRDLELVFKVNEGSSEIWAKVGGFVDALGEGFKKLDRKQRAIVLICLAVLLTGGVLGWKALSESSSTKKAEIEASVKIQNEAQKTRQFELFAQAASREPSLQKFSKAAEEGTTAVIKAVPDATKLSVGRAHFTREEIQEVNQRGARVSSTSRAVTDDFLVFNSESKLSDATRFILAGAEGEFAVIVNHSEFAPEEIDKLWAAARHRTKVRMEVSITRNREVIRAAQIIQFL